MVDDDVVGIGIPYVDAVAYFGIRPGRQVTDAKPQAADDDVVGLDGDRAVFDDDAVSGRSLPGDGEVWLGDIGASLKVNDATCTKHDDPGAGGLQGFEEAAWPCGIQVGHFDDFPAPSAGGHRPKPFRPWEGR